MFIRLLLIFSLVPLIELALLIKVGGYFGVLPTVILVAGTGIIGISLARAQGFQLINEVRTSFRRGQIPADHLIQGLMILIGAAMLLTPGLLTDTSGFLLIIPGSRKIAARFAKKKIKEWITKGKVNVSYDEYHSNESQSKDFNQSDFDKNNDSSIDVDFEEIDD